MSIKPKYELGKSKAKTTKTIRPTLPIKFATLNCSRIGSMRLGLELVVVIIHILQKIICHWILKELMKKQLKTVPINIIATIILNIPTTIHINV